MSPGADFVAVFFMSAGFPSVLMAAQTYTFYYLMFNKVT